MGGFITALKERIAADRKQRVGDEKYLETLAQLREEDAPDE
jgi:hypothetical protein